MGGVRVPAINRCRPPPLPAEFGQKCLDRLPPFYRVSLVSNWMGYSSFHWFSFISSSIYQGNLSMAWVGCASRPWDPKPSWPRFAERQLRCKAHLATLRLFFFLGRRRTPRLEKLDFPQASGPRKKRRTQKQVSLGLHGAGGI